MPSPSRKPGRGGIYTSLDSNLTPHQRAQKAQQAEDLAKYQEYKAASRNPDWYGLMVPGRDGKMRVAAEHLEVSADQIRERHAQGMSWKPIGVDRHGKPVFTDQAKEAMQLGYSCPKCWNLQENPATAECKIRGKPYGCGYRRSLDGW